MGPSHQLVEKILNAGFGAIFLTLCILTASLQNVSPKFIVEFPQTLEQDANLSFGEIKDNGMSSLPPSSPSPSSEPEPSSSASSTEGPGQSSASTAAAPCLPVSVKLNKTYPKYVLNFSLNSTTCHHIELDSEMGSKDFRIAVHLLRACDFPGTIFLEGDNIESTEWSCGKSSIEDGKSKELAKKDFSNGKRVYDRSGNAEEVMVDLQDVRIMFQPARNNDGDNENVGEIRTAIAVNIYKDVDDGSKCHEDDFNCFSGTLCPKCCSEYQEDWGRSGGRSNKEDSLSSFTLALNYQAIMGSSNSERKSKKGARCISKRLTCDTVPSCGVQSNNADESDEVCEPRKFCNCGYICLTWNYALTSLAIAVLFIITPTAIVFALFHRRNVALERARLVRLAQTRTADLRGEFTRDDPINDHPPSYDEVCDTKEPPPCFCQAVAKGMHQEGDGANHQENGAHLPTCSCRRALEQEKRESSHAEDDPSSNNNQGGVGVGAVSSINYTNLNCDTDNK